MTTRFFAVLLAAVLAAGCSTTGPSPVKTTGQPVVNATGQVEDGGQKAAVPADSYSSFGTADALLSHAVTLIEEGTAASLVAGMRLAAEADAIGAEGAAGAGIVGSTLFHELYPDASGTAPASGLAWNEVRLTSAFLGGIAPALSLFDPHAKVDQGLSAGLTQAGVLAPRSPLPPYLLGLLAQRTSGSLSAARHQFETALRSSPAFSPAAAQLGATIIASGSAPSELPLLQHLASLLPTASQRFAALARAEIAAGKPQMAADAAAQGLLQAPDDPAFALLRAQALAAGGDWYQSLWELNALLRLRPDLSEGILLKARILHEDMENDPEALAVLADAEARFPADASFQELHAEILLAQGKTDDGLTVLRHAHELDPGRLDIISLLLSTTARAQKWTDAASWLALVPAESRTVDQLRIGWQVSTGLGDHARALEYAQSLLRQTGGADALALEARSLLSTGRPADALVVIDHALLAMSPPPALASELHFLRSRAGSTDPLLDLRSALKENPDNREALTAIAEALAGQKDYRKATGYAKRASELSPDDTALAQRAEELSRLADAGQ